MQENGAIHHEQGEVDIHNANPGKAGTSVPFIWMEYQANAPDTTLDIDHVATMKHCKDRNEEIICLI